MEFYGTTAQVIPVLLLALTWESGYLARLKNEDRTGYRLWTKPNVRRWGIFMTIAAVTGEGAVLLVLADVIDPGDIPRALGLIGVAALMGSLLVRLIADIVNATK